MARFVLVFAIATSVAAQNTQTPRRRAVSPVLSDQITILQTTDLHHHANGAGHVGLDVDPLTGTSTVGAYARISAYVNYVRTTAGHPVILVDSGDWTMGTLYDLTLASRPLALYFLSAMRYDVVTLGNHEFDYTPRGLAQMISSARSAFAFQTPIVASNMSLGGNSDLAPYFGSGKAIQTTYVEQLSNGMKVGFIGLMGEEAAIDAPASAPVTFAPLSSSYSAIQSIVDGLRNSDGVQVVIALSHSGTNASGTAGEDVDLARHVHGIDVIASGHTHTPLAAAHAVTNGSWTTQIIDAGAFGTNVARLDLRVLRSAGTTTPLAFNNVPMTDASLSAINSGLKSDAATAGVVAATDQQLNRTLAPLFAQFFPDFDPANIGKGIYHPVAVAAQDMVSNDTNPVLSPNGLGDLAADSVRNTPNAIIAQTLAAVGGNPANLPGYDFTPYQLGVVATGVLRGSLPARVPLTFADIYDILPLGISPDTSQLLPIGYPMVSTYVTLADVKKICALQLIGQSNLISSSFYLNISGIRYTLKPAESYTYFKYATAAAVLDTTLRKQAGGSAAALQALLAFFNLGMDQGTALQAARAAGNPYAAAMVKLNDANPDSAQITANLHAIGEVGGAAIVGTTAVNALVVSKAVDAIDTVAAFAATDTTNTGQTTNLSGSTRIRTSVDLYAVLLINAVQSQYGVAITPYQAATGTTVLSSADFPTLLANRIDAAPATAGVQELKEWMALLSNVGSALGGSIGPDYASTPIFTQFGSFGSAVQTRNATYPLPAIGQLVGTIASLQQAP
ncbi:MAG: metallophosphoesterase [Acidobacteriota bacterium]|nr:metallophosphoesterase [Acidobacteriota bacterium]